MLFRNRSGERLIRVVSTALTVALVLLLTPCCEVSAVLFQDDAPANTSTLHTHDHNDDSDAPPSGEHCAPWFEQAFMPVGDAALPSSVPSGLDAALPYTQPSIQFPCMTHVVPHAGAPPPARAVYLLTSRILL